MRVIWNLTLWTFLSLAVVEDVRHMKISNRLIACGLLSGFVIRAVTDGARGVMSSCLNSLIQVILLILFFQMRVLGAGDIKLFSVTGSFLTTEQLMHVILYSFLIAAVLGTGKLVRRYCASEKTQEKYTKMHFSIAILLAVVCVNGGV